MRRVPLHSSRLRAYVFLFWRPIQVIEVDKEMVVKGRLLCNAAEDARGNFRYIIDLAKEHAVSSSDTQPPPPPSMETMEEQPAETGKKRGRPRKKLTVDAPPASSMQQPTSASAYPLTEQRSVLPSRKYTLSSSSSGLLFFIYSHFE